ncbi:MAG TPA: branched-chain amino acid ABC transporter substrate-binding protein [Ottowia sp.]|mgnify:FL=1|jgi:branched-chain amino acid transport system substrate-binding protein|nr:MAG: branched-chain amino acid ABC transporter substrate-binding protein [Ottowia sp.]HMT65860.1 branched-chain amino acid ABC transporter substrate-binding protein [Ottowia sp.]HMT83345.1 branched-chain amino acid ABC transporter substrate-binding protein [Ottowia sp.]HRB10948.1 branched-chain amino acid ABC transporter substrate-binding protein [Ottowia sp.]
MSRALNRRRFSTGLALAPLAAGGLLSGCNSVPDRIKIGVAQPLTGPIHELGKDLLNGVQLAVTELNAGNYTVGGKRVTLEIVSVDDKSDAATGKAVAQQLVEAGVVAVIGHLNSGVSIAAAPIYAAQGIAQIAISTNPKFTELGLDTTFRMVANDHMQAKAMGSFAASQFGEVPYAAVDDGTPYGKGLIEGAVRELKAKKRDIALRQSFDDKTVAFDELAARMKAANVGVILSTLNDFQAVALIEALGKVNHTDVRMLGGDTLKTTGMAKARGLIRGVHATSPVLEAKEFMAGRAFLSRYTDAFKIAPAYGGHYTYDSMHVLADAIQQAKSAQPRDVTAMLRRISGSAPVTGSMRWDEQGEQRYAAVGVYDLGRDGWNLRIRSDIW